MNAVEIEAAVTELVRRPFDAVEFPFDFLAAFGNKDTTIAKLRKGVSNASDIPGGVLQRNNIHLAVAKPGEVHEILTALKQSPETAKAKAKFILATDGETIQAEELITGDPLVCQYEKLDDHFGFFLPLAGITTVKEIKDNPIDIRATSRLNKLYVELLKDNPEWAAAERRPDLNHFLARLIFCFFAEDTNIFHGDGLFTQTIKQMTEARGNNTHLVLEQIFRAMTIRAMDRAKSNVPNYANQFPYVNGGLFSGNTETPKFSRIARSYLIRAGELNWREINPDIFGSMIQAVADDDERGSLGMHYTSVPSILKVLNPLFLDDLNEQLDRAGDHKPSLLKLRERMSRIRVFDPACGSGNFLVIAYKEMRAIEGKINQRRGEIDRASDVHLTNFRGIEIRDFAAEIARLALIIAEFQCDVIYRGPKLALAEFLPLNAENWIVCGNALRLDWTTVCPPISKEVTIVSTANDLFETPLDQPKIEFTHEGGETYVCGNPPYLGSVYQSSDQKAELKAVSENRISGWKSLDYVCAWFILAAQYSQKQTGGFAFVATNSICQGEQVAILWPYLFKLGLRIFFAHTNFKWANLASHSAGVTVVVVGMRYGSQGRNLIIDVIDGQSTHVRIVKSISPYLIPGSELVVRPSSKPLSPTGLMIRGNMANDGGNLVLSSVEIEHILKTRPKARQFIHRYVGSKELIHGQTNYCLWIRDDQVEAALLIPEIRDRLEKVREVRRKGGSQARAYVNLPHRFVFAPHRPGPALAVPRVSSEHRDYLPIVLTDSSQVVSERNFVLYDAPLWNMALIASRIHWVWIGTVCVRMRTDFSYSNTLGWNTFPLPILTEQNKADLTRCAEEILLARERHFPKTIADLYDPEQMPEDLRIAHERNDETLERIYIGRRFKNDTERLEKLFELYAIMTAPENAGKDVKTTKKQNQIVEPQLVD